MLIYFDSRTGKPAAAPFSSERLEAFLPHAPAVGSERYRADTEHGFREMGRYRADSFTSDVTGLALSLTQRRTQILEEPRPVLNSFTKFMTLRDVDPGADEHSVVYGLSDGEAAVYRMGKEIPVVGANELEDVFKQVWLVTSFQENHFQRIASDYAGLRKSERNLRTCLRVLDEKANNINFNGYQGLALYGALNYPRLAKWTISTAFDGTASPTDVLAALNDLANYPGETSKSVYQPNRMITSTRVRNYLAQTYIGAANPNKTILEVFLKGQEHIKDIEAVHEMRDAGGTGTDGIFAYNDGRDFCNVVVSQGPTPHAPYTIGLDTVTIVSMRVGGCTMWYPGANILGYVTAAS